MKIKRAPLLGAVIILLIIILLLTNGIYKYINLKNTNTLLQLTVDEHVNTIKTLTKNNEELKANILNLENIISEKIFPQTSRGLNVTLNDREILARLVFLEANTESLECQKAVVSVIINRVNSGYWGSTVNSVVYAKNQFTPASRIPYVTPTATNYEAVDYVLANGVTLPSYCLYFRVGYHFSWNGYVPYTSIGNTYFGYMAKDKQ